jgi:hypothetical protein
MDALELLWAVAPGEIYAWSAEIVRGYVLKDLGLLPPNVELRNGRNVPIALCGAQLELN